MDFVTAHATGTGRQRTRVSRSKAGSRGHLGEEHSVNIKESSTTDPDTNSHPQVIYAKLRLRIFFVALFYDMSPLGPGVGPTRRLQAAAQRLVVQRSISGYTLQVRVYDFSLKLNLKKISFRADGAVSMRNPQYRSEAWRDLL